MKQYKIKRDINGTLEIVGFEYHYDDEVCHRKRKIALENEPRIPGEFPIEPGDIKELAE